MNAEAQDFDICREAYRALCEKHAAVGISMAEIVAADRPPPKEHYYNEATGYFLPDWYRDLNPYPW